MKLVIDAFGGDYSPDEIIEGAVLSIKKYDDLNIILTGDLNKIENYFSVHNLSRERIEIIDAPNVIGAEEAPTTAIKREGTSLGGAFNILKKDEEVDALIS